LESSGFNSAELKYHFDHPDCGRGNTWYRNRLPLRDDLVIKPREILAPPEAVGLLFVEGLSPMRTLRLGVGYFVITLVFGITWWVVKRDIQGAFGAAAYLVSFLSILAIVVTVHSYSTLANG